MTMTMPALLAFISLVSGVMYHADPDTGKNMFKVLGLGIGIISTVHLISGVL